MFENIIGHRDITATLRAELTEGRFPRSSLFFGPAYCAKLSTALEVARVLTCRDGRGEWSCECQSCRLQRELAHPHTILLGPRYSDVEIAACEALGLRQLVAVITALMLPSQRCSGAGSQLCSASTNNSSSTSATISKVPSTSSQCTQGNHA